MSPVTSATPTSERRLHARPRCDAGIAGWHGAGMLDWPGRVATTIFIAGCNLRCPYCHNPSILSADAASQDAIETLRGHLQARRGWVDGIVITGGEPTTDPALFQLLDDFAELCLPVKLDTNGTNPDVLIAALESRLVSYVALDVKTVPERYAEVTGLPDAWARVRSSITAVLGYGTAHEFRTTAYPGAVEPGDLPKIAALLEGGDSYVIQQFRAGRTLAGEAGVRNPYSPDLLYEAAALCAQTLPTTVRGA